MSRIRRSRSLQAILVAAIMSLALGIPATADLNLILGESAQVSYTQGAGVNLRDSIGFGGSVISTIGEGVAVTVLDGPVMSEDGSYWYYVSAWGTEGWIISDYLALPPGSYGQIVNTGGAGVNLRAEASISGGVITTLHEGATVRMIDGPAWGDDGSSWMYVDFEGIYGWVHTNYIASTGSAPASSGGDVVRTTNVSWTAYVSGTDGAGLRIRTSASVDSETLAVMPEGAAVNVLASDIYSSDGSAWYNVEFEGIVGYSMAWYFSESAPSWVQTVEDTPAPAVEPAASTSEVWPGVNAVVTGTGGGGINLRYEGSYNSGVITVVGEGSVVYVIDGPYWDGASNPWYQVEYDSMTGWIHGGYLAYTEASASDGAAVSETERSIEPVEQVVTTVGGSIVNEALRYVGLPYVWGGTTPAGFDCSGFTWYVLSNVLGISLSRALDVQAVSGYYVSQSELQQGDLVFFQNTYTWGLSHVGIYIGGGQFVHAGSERTGVLISDLQDSYWGPRYYTARRVN